MTDTPIDPVEQSAHAARLTAIAAGAVDPDAVITFPADPARSIRADLDEIMRDFAAVALADGPEGSIWQVIEVFGTMADQRFRSHGIGRNEQMWCASDDAHEGFKFTDFYNFGELVKWVREHWNCIGANE